jgi:hypothetical protein
VRDWGPPYQNPAFSETIAGHASELLERSTPLDGCRVQRLQERSQSNKSFLVLFFKKEHFLSYLVRASDIDNSFPLAVGLPAPDGDVFAGDGGRFGVGGDEAEVAPDGAHVAGLGGEYFGGDPGEGAGGLVAAVGGEDGGGAAGGLAAGEGEAVGWVHEVAHGAGGADGGGAFGEGELGGDQVAGHREGAVGENGRGAWDGDGGGPGGG